MSNFNPEAVFITPEHFLAEALGRMGVQQVSQLNTRDMARIALDYHCAQFEEDEANVAQLGLDPDQQERALELICVRGVTMRRLLERLIGFEGPYNFDQQS